MPHSIQDLLSELPPCNAGERDVYKETLLVPRHNLTVKLRKMLHISALERKVETLQIWLYILGISHFALVIVLILCLT